MGSLCRMLQLVREDIICKQIVSSKRKDATLALNFGCIEP